jgi:hypothetical protein
VVSIPACVTGKKNKAGINAGLVLSTPPGRLSSRIAVNVAGLSMMTLLPRT